MKEHGRLEFALRLASGLTLGLVVALVLVAASGESPSHFLSVIWESSFSTPSAFLNMLRWTGPILLSALAYVIAARAGIFNVGVEGGVVVGALSGAAMGIYAPVDGIGGIAIVSLAGALGGLLYQSVPAFIHVYYNVNEVVTTLMMNYIAVLMCNFVVREMLLARTDTGIESITVTSAPIVDGVEYARFTPSSSANWSLVLVAVIVALFAIYLLRTRGGYDIAAVGGSSRYARYIGVEHRRTKLRAFLWSGALGGLVGTLEVQGVLTQYIDGAFTNFGWNGLLAGLIALNHPLGIIPAALLLGILENAKLSIAQFTSVSPYMIQFLAAVLILIFAIDPIRKTLGRRHNSSPRPKKVPDSTEPSPSLQAR